MFTLLKPGIVWILALSLSMTFSLNHFLRSATLPAIFTFTSTDLSLKWPRRLFQSFFKSDHSLPTFAFILAVLVLMLSVSSFHFFSMSSHLVATFALNSAVLSVITAFNSSHFALTFAFTSAIFTGMDSIAFFKPSIAVGNNCIASLAPLRNLITLSPTKSPIGSKKFFQIQSHTGFRTVRAVVRSSKADFSLSRMMIIASPTKLAIGFSKCSQIQSHTGFRYSRAILSKSNAPASVSKKVGSNLSIVHSPKGFKTLS